MIEKLNWWLHFRLSHMRHASPCLQLLASWQAIKVCRDWVSMQGGQAAHLALGRAHGSVLNDKAVVKLLHLGPRVLDGHALAGWQALWGRLHVCIRVSSPGHFPEGAWQSTASQLSSFKEPTRMQHIFSLGLKMCQAHHSSHAQLYSRMSLRRAHRAGAASS